MSSPQGASGRTLLAGQQPDRERGGGHTGQLAPVPQLAIDQAGANDRDHQLGHDDHQDDDRDFQLLAGQGLLQADRAGPVDQPGGQTKANRFPGEPGGVTTEQRDKQAEGGQAEQEATLHPAQAGDADQQWPKAKAQAGQKGEVHGELRRGRGEGSDADRNV